MERRTISRKSCGQSTAGKIMIRVTIRILSVLAPLRSQLLESGSRPHDGLRALGASGYAADFYPGTAFNERQVLFCLRRQLFIGGNSKSRSRPTWQALVYRLDGFDLAHRSGHFFQRPALRSIARADRNLVEFV